MPLPSSGGAGGADFLLDALGAGFADQQILVAADIGDDRLVHLVAADAHTARIDDAAQRQHRDFRRAAADIHHHRAGGFGDRQAGADGGRHRFFDQKDAARAGRQSRFLNRAAFHRGRAGGHADDDHGIGEGAAVMHFADEMLDHFFGDFEIGDDAVAQRADGLDIAGRAAQHQLGLVADGAHGLLAAAGGDGGHHRRLIQHDAPAFDIDQRIRRPKIDGHVARKRAKKTAEHA